MLQRITNRLNREDKGFTLIELMVVVLIIAILIAVAIPTFLGARTRAQDRAAQSSLRNSVTAAKALFTDNEDYTQATVAAMTASEPSVTFQAAASTGPLVVSVNATAVDEWHAAVLSNSGTCWYVRDAVDPLTNPGTGWMKDTSAPVCTGAQAALLADASYADTPGTAPNAP